MFYRNAFVFYLSATSLETQHDNAFVIDASAHITMTTFNFLLQRDTGCVEMAGGAGGRGGGGAIKTLQRLKSDKDHEAYNVFTF